MLAMAQGDIGKRVRIARETLAPGKLRIADLAKEIGVSHGRLSNWERGKHDPPLEFVNAIAKALDVSAKYLLTGSQSSVVRETSGPLYPVSHARLEIPFGGYVPAGSWADPFETENLIEVESKFDAAGRFACRIEGDSMYPFLQPDDLVIFQVYKTRRPMVGHIVLARKESDNSVTVKTLTHDGQRYHLTPINPTHKADIESEWKVIAFLVGYERRRGLRTRTEYDPEGLRPDPSEVLK